MIGSSEERQKLLDILIHKFAPDELRSLVYVINAPIEGGTQQDTAISLLQFLESTGRIGELIELIRARRPNIDLTGLVAEAQPGPSEQADFVDQRDAKSASDSPYRAKRTQPEIAARIGRRRPGYDLIYDLVQKYDELSSDERAQMREPDLSEFYVQPMFQALGWTVWVVQPHTLELEYKDLRVPIEIKKPAGNLLDSDTGPLQEWFGGPDWGILTNFETIHLWDLRNPNRPNLILETSPWYYVTDDREEDDLLAASVFYEKMAKRSSPSRSIESLIDRLNDRNASVRQAAVEALGETRDPSAVEHLIPVLSDANESIRLATVVALGKIGDSRAVEHLVSVLADSNESIRQAAVEALGQIGDLRAVEYLTSLANDPNESIREAVVEALGKISAPQSSESRPSVKSAESKRIEVAIRALADTPSKVDLLGFSDYAEALADFISNERTEKPLTIGIDAAWGMGKTTLMHMVEDRLARQHKGKHKRSFLTVWFNAWKYDQEESLWAALALEILAQVRTQFNWWQRACFWLKLSYRRLDRALIWRSVLKLLAGVFIIYLLGAIVFGIVAIWLGTDVFWKYAGTVGILGLIAAIYAAGKDIYDRLAGPFDLKLADYVRKPDYKERVGFLAQFDEDFKRVIDVVTEGGKWPLVVFIDDLDRCAPPKPAEIIEAINILLDAQHCVFVVGMDARAVAGSIEAKYQDLCDYLGGADDPGGLTLGQRFLEKIVQISFRIPRVDPKVVESFIDANLNILHDTLPEHPPKTAVMEAEQLIKAEQRAGKSLDEAVQAVQTSRLDIPQSALTEAREEVFAQSFDDCDEVRRAIHEAAPYLGFNPRKIKRFINNFRLQALIANRRGLLRPDAIRLDLLAKCLIVTMRWPDFALAVAVDNGFVPSLIDIHDEQRRLKDLQGRSPKDQVEDAQALELRMSDPRIKRWADATELVDLLKQIVTQTGFSFAGYFALTQMTGGRASIGAGEEEYRPYIH